MFSKAVDVPKAETIIVGNEITSGLVQDTNSATLAKRLLEAGVDVSRVSIVGDDEKQIEDAVVAALGRVDLVVVTGGLGGTHDDVTKSVLARAFGSGFRRDDEALANIERIYQKRGAEISPLALKQCWVPEKAEILYNEKGTAPGLLFKKNEKVLFALPGVPLEMEHLLEKYVLPRAARPGGIKLAHRMLKTTGIPESRLWELFGPMEPLEKMVMVASLPSHLGVRVRLSAWGNTDEETAHKLDLAEKLLRIQIGEYIFGVDDETLEKVVGEMLTRQGKTIAVAESCTGGLISHRLTNVSGSSEYVLESAVTYSNEAKTARLGVGAALIAEHGAVSRPVAEAMARGVCETAHADVGLAVTGIAGPTGGTDEKPVGLVFIALSSGEQTLCEEFRFHQDRVRNKERAAQAALNMLRLWLKSSDSWVPCSGGERQD